MEVFVNGFKYEYRSDYPDGWKFISKDYFKYPVLIGNNACFIKRFERKQHGISGWGLLEKLRSKSEPNLPKVHDRVTVEENKREVHYAFYEHKKGHTLDVVLAGESALDLSQFVDDLFSALSSLHKHDFWFSDFCEKNIFCDDNERFFLIDIDSCEHASVAPSNDMDIDMRYLVLVLKFYKDILHLKVNPANVPGILLNYLQTCFLALNLKKFLSGDQDEYMSDQVFKRLPESLHELDPAFAEIFKEILTGVKQSGYAHQARRIRKLIFDKIVLSGDQAVEANSASVLFPSDLRDDNARETVKVAEVEKVIEPSNEESRLPPLPAPPPPRSVKMRTAFWVTLAVVITGVMMTVWSAGIWKSPVGNSDAPPLVPISTISHDQPDTAPGHTGPNEQMSQKKGGHSAPQVGSVRSEGNTKDPPLQADRKREPTAGTKAGDTGTTSPKKAHTASLSAEPTQSSEQCTAICRTKGISGVHVSFKDAQANKTYTLVSEGKDLEFAVRWELLHETVIVSFTRNGQSEFRNVRLKEFEIPEMFRNNY